MQKSARVGSCRMYLIAKKKMFTAGVYDMSINRQARTARRAIIFLICDGYATMFYSDPFWHVCRSLIVVCNVGLERGPIIVH